MQPASDSPPRVAVLGHVEWAEFVVVESLPRPGEIVAARESMSLPAGGGAVAAVQIARLGARCRFFTALGDDEFADRTGPWLRKRGLRVEAGRRPVAQRRAFVHLERSGERTITTIGSRLAPEGGDDLDWDAMDQADAVYVTAGDSAAIRAAGKARRVVATIRAAGALFESGVRIDALVASRNDPGERVDPSRFRVRPKAVVRTDGSRGGVIETAEGEQLSWGPQRAPGPWVDSYGAGDSFAGGLTFGLALGMPLPQAVAVGAFCGAGNVTGRGPYAGQPGARELAEWQAEQT